jgi:hypothetical protein
MEDMASRETVINHLKMVPDEALDEILDSRGLERCTGPVRLFQSGTEVSFIAGCYRVELAPRGSLL